MELSKTLLCGFIAMTFAAQGCGEESCPVPEVDGGMAVAQCGPYPAMRENSYVTYTGSEAKFHCFPGFEISGDDTRTCTDGTWEGQPPGCNQLLHFDAHSQLEWDARPPTAQLTFPEAETYCSNLVLEGRSDWRMPGAREMSALFTFSSIHPVVDTRVFGLSYESMWLAGAENGGLRLTFEPGFGWFPSAAPLTTRAVRCVRGTFAAPELTDNEDGTVTDSVTGLTWQQATEDVVRAQSAAVSYCAGLTLDGGGFRVPTARELLSIYQTGEAMPFDDTYFDDVPSRAYWTTSAPSNGAHFTFVSTTSSYVIISQGSEGSGALVRCVR